jgi:hypothetical protein
MKRLHRNDLYGWSVFDKRLNIDFHSVLWVRPGGNVVIDPLPLSDHDASHIDQLGSVSTIVITNSDHARASKHLAEATGARLVGPADERNQLECDAWLNDGDSVVPGLTVISLNGSKTPGELALLLEETTLITGDLVRAHAGGRLTMLPDAKLADPAAARESVRALTRFRTIDAVLPGDGWPVFSGGLEALEALVAGFENP